MGRIETTDWNEEWKRARAQCTTPVRDEAFWNERAPSFVEKPAGGYAEAFLDIVRPEKSWTVLDMASGAGVLAIPLARHVRSVTAVDYSGAMLGRLEERCGQAGISNIRALKARWEDNWSEVGIGAHDVAVASRALVVDDLLGAVLKLSGIARKRVYISTIVDDGPYDRSIYEAVGRKLDAGPDYIYNYNLLYQIGIRANVSFITEEHRKVYGSRTEAVDSMRWMVAGMTSKEEKRYQDHFDRHLLCNEGGWTMDYRRTVRWAVIWWDSLRPQETRNNDERDRRRS
jgi:SAM-dependent methyltransferase